MMCKSLTNRSETLYKALLGNVLIWVIRQCLHIDKKPWFIHKNKSHSCSYMEVWAPQNFDNFTCFYWSRNKNKWKREGNIVELFFLTRNDLREVYWWIM